MTQILVLALAGLVVGFSSGLLGIGGGVVLVPILLFVFKLEMHIAIGTSLAIIIPTALCSSIVHYTHGNVALKVVLSMFIFTIIGGFIGAHCAHILPASTLKKIFDIDECRSRVSKLDVNIYDPKPSIYDKL